MKENVSKYTYPTFSITLTMLHTINGRVCINAHNILISQKIPKLPKNQHKYRFTLHNNSKVKRISIKDLRGFVLTICFGTVFNIVQDFIFKRTKCPRKIMHGIRVLIFNIYTSTFEFLQTVSNYCAAVKEELCWLNVNCCI